MRALSLSGCAGVVRRSKGKRRAVAAQGSLASKVDQENLPIDFPAQVSKAGSLVDFGS